MKRHISIALVLAAPLLLLGCGGDVTTKPPPPAGPFVYPDQSTPEKTLLRMAAAFARRDSAMTDSVYADDYEGTSTDMTDPFPATMTFVESDEIGLVGAFARSSDVTYLNMDLKSPGTWNKTHYVSDPAGWISVQIPSFLIEVGDAVSVFTARSPSTGVTHVFEFTLRPTPDATSPTDTTWTIVRWTESRSNP